MTKNRKYSVRPYNDPVNSRRMLGVHEKPSGVE